MITLLSLCGEKLIPRTLLNIMIQKVESRSSKANSLKRIDLHQAWFQGRKRKSSPKESIHHLLRYCVARIRRESKHGSKLRNSNFLTKIKRLRSKLKRFVDSLIIRLKPLLVS